MSKRNLLLTIGGVVVLAVAGIVAYSRMLRKDQYCQLCSEEIHQGMGYTIKLTEGGVLKTCCPTCGLRFQGHDPTKVASAYATDFETGKLIAAANAYYVEGSDVIHCDPNRVMRDNVGGVYTMAWHRCYPSLVSFSTRRAAEAFLLEHGGRVVTFAEAKEAVRVH